MVYTFSQDLQLWCTQIFHFTGKIMELSCHTTDYWFRSSTYWILSHLTQLQQA